MRKILLASTALVALTGAAYADEAPISVNLGGYVDFRAAQFHESDKSTTTPGTRADHDFQTEYRVNIAADGKAANGMEYGGLISLWNGAEYNDPTPFTGGGNSVREDQGYVWLSGAWGKAVLGDDHGASDLFVYAPTVGEGQIDGSYTNFTDLTSLFSIQPSYIDNTENSTKITYYTPKVGNDNNKLQLGVSYAPNFYGSGELTDRYRAGASTPYAEGAYQDYVKATAQYTGNFSPVATVLSATIQTASRGADSILGSSASLRDFTSWGLGGQAMYAGWTVGGSYVDGGRYGTLEGQNNPQDSWTLGAKYEFNKVAVALNGIRGRGYDNLFAVTGVGNAEHTNYVKEFDAVGAGATYTWFPGLTTAADLMFFSQDRADNAGNDDGHVIMITQKITF